MLIEAYVIKRYIIDIGVRDDKTKVAVEDFVAYVDSSTSTCIDI